MGVDPQSRHFLLEAVRRFAAAGHTVIYTSHYMEEVEALCAEVAIMDHGKVLVAGALAEVTRSAAAGLGLTLTRPLPEALAAAWRERFATLTLAGNLVRWPEFALDELGALLAELAAAGVGVERVDYGAANLEQVFMRLTHHSLRD
ncbi:hypothetical protein AGMMS49960_22030 [Betaproteobacteria bacterium]|nr:hypothetical protein AGMMS49960_22030 [Betaproteobacteria bacterium]